MDHVIIDCSSSDGPAEWLVPHTEQEAEQFAALQAVSAQRARDEAAAEQKRSAALEALRSKAKLSPDVALLADALGVDLSA